MMVRFLLVAMASLLLSSCTHLQTDPLREGARLMAELRAASGAAARDVHLGYHETGIVVAGGETSTYETWGDYHSLRSALTRVAGKPP